TANFHKNSRPDCEGVPAIPEKGAHAKFANGILGSQESAWRIETSRTSYGASSRAAFGKPGIRVADRNNKDIYTLQGSVLVWEAKNPGGGSKHAVARERGGRAGGLGSQQSAWRTEMSSSGSITVQGAGLESQHSPAALLDIGQQ